MQITILNGAPDPGENDLAHFTTFITEVAGAGNEIQYFPLANMQIKHCTGCWTCWWKTPGLCIWQDDADTIFESVINSDLVVFASPILAGFTSSLLKRLQDRLIVLIHPYIQLVQGECHHRKRYDSYPDFGLLLSKDADSDEEDIQIITDIYKRLALNFHCQLKHVWINPTPKQKETTHDISHY
ncbi:MAG: flavodoxin family protein [Bacteroidetes bacterium]|nr:MAG: flavodoxin family protein [Bacteroidota bacterium]